jgi:uncharacterized membrane protein
LSGWDHAAILLTALQLAAAVHVWVNGVEGVIPMHFDLQGNVDRWGDRREAAVFVLVCGVATFLTHLGLNWASSRGRQDKGSQGARVIFRAIALLAPASFSVLIAGVALGLYWGDPSNVLRTTLALVWVLIAAVGAACGKVSPNPWAGVRVYWTRKSRLAWERSNRLLGRIYFFGGLAGLFVTPFLPVSRLTAVFVTVVLGGAVISILEAWRTWKTDPERLP